MLSAADDIFRLRVKSRLRLLLHVRIPTKAQTDRRIRAASTIIDILTFMSMINYMVSCVEHEKNFVISEPSDFSAKVLRYLFRSKTGKKKNCFLRICFFFFFVFCFFFYTVFKEVYTFS